jgi:hypothetical protein
MICRCFQMSFLVFNIRKEVGGFRWFSFIFEEIWKNRIYDILSLMLDPYLKVSNWFHMLLIEIRGFPLWKNVINNLFFQCFWNVTKSYTLWQNLDLWQTTYWWRLQSWFFEMYVGTNEPTKELVNRVLQMFRRNQVDAIDIKSLL